MKSYIASQLRTIFKKEGLVICINSMEDKFIQSSTIINNVYVIRFIDTSIGLLTKTEFFEGFEQPKEGSGIMFNYIKECFRI